MLKLKKIKLLQLEEDRLRSFSMSLGDSGYCSCGCLYYGEGGGSSTADNKGANSAYGYHSPGYDPCGCKADHSDLARYQAFWGQ